MSSSRIQCPLDTACVKVPGCQMNFPGMSVQRYIPSNICNERSYYYTHYDCKYARSNWYGFVVLLCCQSDPQVEPSEFLWRLYGR